MAIGIMQRFNSSEDPEKGVKVPGTGLVLYPGGIQKTPTGLSNAFSNSGLIADDLLAYAEKYNLPTTSNREFQQAQYNLLNSTAKGRNIIKAMEAKYGQPKAGSYVDDILGVRTMSMIDAMKNKPEEYVPYQKKTRDFKLSPPSIKEMPKQKSNGLGPYIIYDENDQPLALYNDYDKYSAHISRARDRGIGISKGTSVGQVKKPGGKENEIIPKTASVNLNYNDDVFTALDLPHEEKDFEGTFQGYSPYERTKTPLGVIDKETGKFIPQSINPSNNIELGKKRYLEKMIKQYPELFDLDKVVTQKYLRKFESGKNEYKK